MPSELVNDPHDLSSTDAANIAGGVVVRPAPELLVEKIKIKTAAPTACP
jgi:hypothetical protein